MNWYKNLYIGESIKGSEKKIIKKIKRNAGQIGIYIISLASNGEDNFDIIPAWEFTLLRKHMDDISVVGLSGDYEEALLLACDILMGVYRDTGRLDARKYILENWEDK